MAVSTSWCRLASEPVRRLLRARTLIPLAVVALSGVGGRAALAQGIENITFPIPLNSNAAIDLGDDTTPRVATDGAGVWVALWASTNTLGGAIGTDWDILFARSTDGGASWSAPQALNRNATHDSGADFSPIIVTDSAGNWLALWVSDDTLGGTTGPDRDIFVSRSNDAGLTWTPPALLNTNGTADTGDDFIPQVATDGAVWVTVWVSDDTFGGALDEGFDVLFARSLDGGVSWSAPQPLRMDVANATIRPDSEARVVTDGAGTWLTIWTSENPIGGPVADPDILISRSMNDGGTWSPPQLLNTDGADDIRVDINPDIATDRAGTWVAVWAGEAFTAPGDPYGTDRDIFFTRSTDGGLTWSPPLPVNSNAASNGFGDTAPKINTDGRGTWVTVWESKDPLGSGLSGSIGFDFDILFAESVDGGATWSVSQPLNINASSDDASDSYVNIATDGHGAWVVAWRSRESTIGGPLGVDMDILTARLTTRSPTVPSTSAWGLIVLTLLLLTGAKVHFGRKQGLKTPA